MTEATASPVQTGELLALSPEEWPDVEDLVTEDDTPVDNFFSEKQQRLLTEPLYTSWPGPGDKRPFLVSANVRLFSSVHEPPLVPDVFLSLDVQVAEDWWAKRKRTYFFWEFAKPPEVVIEVVSNREGGETDYKLRRYAQMGIVYYVIFDPLEQIQEGKLRVYQLSLPRRVYVETAPHQLEGIGLGLTLWPGAFEGKEDLWLRWQDEEGNLIPTGAEQRQRADRLAAQLRALGVEPDER